MPYKPQARCPACLQLHDGTGTCAGCSTRSKRRRRPYTAAERERRAQAVAEHRAQYGDWCPGWGRPDHTAEPWNPLTADHIDPVARGGPEDGPLQVLCRSCNSAKGSA
ncbi:HNH endonuclease [Actinomadura sp. ATCC 31491]|uniref:HNH endonuclease n=1 Tax=Actinomadura luzonensis TaxID=2805427 RepID=A0ABT0FQI4_9ACTN|nr:HNH endonuclease [Actinomadura luzonensis]MCK2214275.1 HNH endonuclease [Actinomadura luzonensis]